MDLLLRVAFSEEVALGTASRVRQQVPVIVTQADKGRNPQNWLQSLVTK